MRTVAEILADAKLLAVEYRLATGKPLGIVGEVAEFEAQQLLGLKLATARSPGYDATRTIGTVEQRIQIKGRAVDVAHPRAGRLRSIKFVHPFESVIVVLLDAETFEPFEIWEAPSDAIQIALMKPGSKARNERGALAIAQFCRLGSRILQSAKSMELETAKHERVQQKLATRQARRVSPEAADVFTSERRRRWKEQTENSAFNCWLASQVQNLDGSLSTSIGFTRLPASGRSRNATSISIRV